MSICTAQERKAAFEQVFMTHRWGNPANSGRKNEKGDKGGYVRSYSKTAKAATRGPKQPEVAQPVAKKGKK
jgi:hypothetical protein